MKCLVLKYKGLLLKEESTTEHVPKDLIAAVIAKSTGTGENYVPETELVKATAAENHWPAGLYDDWQNWLMYGQLYQEAKGFIEENQAPLYIACDCAADYVWISLKRNKLHVNDVISSDSLKAHTISPEFYTKLKEKCGEDVIYVTAEEKEAEAAAKAGVTPLILNHEEMSSSKFRTVRNIRDLVLFLK